MYILLPINIIFSWEAKLFNEYQIPQDGNSDESI